MNTCWCWKPVSLNPNGEVSCHFLSYLIQSLDIDAGWLDRLDMGFDFSDILQDSALPDYNADDGE